MASPLRLSAARLAQQYQTHPNPIPRITRVISLDAMNTLIAPKEPPTLTYAKFAEKSGIRCEESALTPAFYKAMQQNSLKHPCFGYNSIGATKWWTNVIESSIRKAADVEPDEKVLESVAKELFEFFAEKDAWKIVDEEIPSVLSQLRHRGFSLAVTSNFDFRLRSLLRQMELAPLFDVIVTSGELGFEKPDAKIFDVVFKHFELDNPSEIVHIGDSLRKDYIGAKDFGAKSLLFDPLLSEDAVDLDCKVVRFKDLSIY